MSWSEGSVVHINRGNAVQCNSGAKKEKMKIWFTFSAGAAHYATDDLECCILPVDELLRFCPRNPLNLLPIWTVFCLQWYLSHISFDEESSLTKLSRSTLSITDECGQQSQVKIFGKNLQSQSSFQYHHPPDPPSHRHGHHGQRCSHTASLSSSVLKWHWKTSLAVHLFW